MSGPIPPAAPATRMTCPKCHQGYNVGNWTPGKTVMCPACKVELSPAGSMVGCGAVVTPTVSMNQRPAPPLAAYMAPTIVGPPPDSLALDPPEHDDLFPQMPDLKQAPATDLSKLIPPEFNGYRVLKEIARGGMGVVLLAEQPSLRRKVAMKLMLPSAESNDPAARERFLREARAMAKLKHPYIIQVYDIGEVQGMPWFTMEFVDGRTLAELIDEKRIDVNQAVEVHIKVAQALSFAHSLGILHRDLKPGNIMVRKTGDPVLMDFGLAKDVTGESVKLSITGTVLGTPAYMSPEQAQALQLDARADVYSLGAVLYEAVTGHVPFEGKTAFATIYQVIHDNPTPARSLNPAVPPDLSRVCAKAMEKDPVDRYATMQELASELERFLHGDAITAQGPSLEQQVRFWIKTHRMHCVAGISVAAVLMVVLLLMGGGWLRATPPAKVDLRKTMAEGSFTTRVARIQTLVGELLDGKIKKGTGEEKEACRILEELTADDHPDIAVAAIEGLAKAAPEQTSVDIFGAQTAAGRPLPVRRAALDALIGLQKQGTSLHLGRVMENDPEIDLRLRAIRGMGRNVDPSVMTTLMKIAARGQPRVVAEAAREKLKELRTPDSIVSMYAGSRSFGHAQALGEMLDKTSAYERQLEEMEAEIHPAAKKPEERAALPFEVAIQRMKDGDKDQRMMAAYDLGLMASQESEDSLRKALEDPEVEVALTAAESLGKIPNLKSPAKLLELLDAEKFERPSTRLAAARACGIVNPAPQGAVLAGALAKERDAGVQVELAQALGRLRPPEAKLPLLAVLVEGAMPARIKAVWALGQLGDKSVCPALVSALEKAGPNDKDLKAELAGALSALTGKSLGTDAARWREVLK